jgi:hypothetical protein
MKEILGELEEYEKYYKISQDNNLNKVVREKKVGK